MKVTVMTQDDRFFSIEVDADELVENVKALLEVEAQIRLSHQRILHNGKELHNTQRLNAVGVVDNDLLLLVPLTAPASTASNDLALNPDGSAVNPLAVLARLRSDPEAMKHLAERSPEVTRAVRDSNVQALQDFLRLQHRHRLELQKRQNDEIALLNADPLDLEAQRKIEEAIRQRNIDENWEAALEHNPEAFASVVMLYVDMEVNGHHIKAFIDSGAQTTIISRSCAERCGLLRLMDKRFVGIARGVGQTEIVGKIHVAPLKIGSNFYPCSFTVLDQRSPDFIFGLDMLRKHQCCIDLHANVLRVGGGEIAVPFLQEKDIPMHHFHDDTKAEAAFSPPRASAFASASAGGRSSQAQRQQAEDSSSSESKISRLMGLGFDRAAVLRALAMCNGNEEHAASVLFGGFLQ